MGERAEGRREMDFSHPTPHSPHRGEVAEGRQIPPGSSAPCPSPSPHLWVQPPWEWWILGTAREGCAASTPGQPSQTFLSPCPPSIPSEPHLS